MPRHNTFRLAARVAWVDFMLRFKRTKLGVIWGVVNPFLMFAVLFIVLTRFRATHSEHLFIPSLLLGLLTWEVFSDGTSLALTHMLQKRVVIHSIAFPLISLPLASVIQTVVIFLIALIILLGALPFVGVTYTWIQLIYIIPFLSLILFTFGVACLVAAVGSLYPDILHIWRWVLRIGFFVSPVFYTTDLLLPKNRPWFLLNPIARILETSRAALLLHTIVWGDLIIILVIALATAGLGIVVFQRLSPSIRDRI